MSVRRGVAAAVATALCAWLVVGPAAGAAVPAGRAAAQGGLDCGEIGDVTTPPEKVEGDNPAYEQLRVAEAHAIARKRGVAPGAGVDVVVVDSGIRPRDPALQSGHGPLVAGLVRGPDQQDPDVPIGIAPAARLIDRPFYDAPRGQGDDAARPPETAALAARLAEVRRGLAPDRRTVVLVPVTVRPSAALSAEVQALARAGALVVAPVGDRPSEDSDPVLGDFQGTPQPGEDAAAAAWPAGHAAVVSVGASAPGALATVVRSSGVDLAAPGGDTVSVAMNGSPCRLTATSSHWAAAQVAGVAALVWSVHATDPATRLRTRLEATATGNGSAQSASVGHGVVQPVEALQRGLEAGAGAGGGEVVERAQQPPEQADLLADTRRDAVWWGLLGGAALVVLLVLRPVLARRRR